MLPTAPLPGANSQSSKKVAAWVYVFPAAQLLYISTG